MTTIITILDIVQAAGACCRKGYSETFKTFQFGKDRSFYGVSEYDAQFVPKMTAMPPAPPVTETHSFTAAMNARYSAHNLLRPPPPPAVEETPPVASRTGAKISSVTENNQSCRDETQDECRKCGFSLKQGTQIRSHRRGG